MTETISRFDFRDLFVLDLANNHQGSVDHGKAVIAACSEVVKRYGVRAVLKFQFRDLKTFVHVSQRMESTNKHVPRFLSTELSWAQFQELLNEVRARGLISMCTPFDEASVDKIVEMGFNVIKVASCSARDWPLLARVTTSGLPVIASTGGLTLDEVDDLVSFLEHRGCDFALMHCVSIYPTPDAACELANIAAFRERYPGRVMGWSTHENQDDDMPVAVAAAVGAQMFERHVGLPTDTIKLNAYSSNPEQLGRWIASWKKAKTLLGTPGRGLILPEERASLDDLKRGVFVRKAVKAGTALTEDDIYFAFPCPQGGIASGEWREGIVVNTALAPNQGLSKSDIEIPGDPDFKILKDAIHEVKALLNLAKVPQTSEFTVEYSHHYGVRNFRQVGAVLINVINREYCKKVLVQMPGQMHPMHFHPLKEETFLVLWGKLDVEVDGRHKTLERGDTMLVQPGVWHRFWTETGCVFEEISTKYLPNDSVYRDDAINKLSSAQRKTIVDHWGRFQLTEQLRSAQVPVE